MLSVFWSRQVALITQTKPPKTVMGLETIWTTLRWGKMRLSVYIPGRASGRGTTGRNSPAVLSGGRLLGATPLPSGDFLPFASASSAAIFAHRKLSGGSNHQGPGRSLLQAASLRCHMTHPLTSLSWFWGKPQEQPPSQHCFVTPLTSCLDQQLNHNKG